MARGKGGSLRAKKQRVRAMHEELLDLSVLNAVLFEELSASSFAYDRMITTRFDFTDPKRDRCQVEKHWDLRTEGDFFLVRMLGQSIYFVVGDATGHNAYAGGLKVFIAAALKGIFERLELGRREPTCARIINELRNYFDHVAAKSLQVSNQTRQLQDGADLVVLRVDLERRKVSFASAGIPIIALGSPEPSIYGRFDSTKGIRFPDPAGASLGSTPVVGSIDARKFGFLAIVTDGFRNLRRLPVGSRRTNRRKMDGFGDEATTRALVRGVRRAAIRPGKSTDQIAASLINAAREFRKNHKLPETADDDRLVVVIDIAKALATSG
ncbi:SpoIIE family protein phosphatase [Bradyrhizobium diazoefficiens]|uniref:SpoIIE family protein phosphatase n=1 Tax=Bradyrhizobium diazoefficiens TaxID=1355477 RepID=UPI00272C47EB|nr:SpoIIE family protein phosphatase [Bradyrhizobium diazoefficiens]WLA74088.1 SpoIIE family protein phosphatase [Bradyrhizobium diazoefficiens]